MGRRRAFALGLLSLSLAACTQMRVDGSGASGAQGDAPGLAQGDQPQHQVQSDPDTLATFTAASSLSIGLTGTIWVADRGGSHLVKIAPDGTRSRAGLPGGKPTAVDASGGLRILVADELEGTIDVHGLSGDLLMRLRLPVSAEEDFASTPEFIDNQPDAADRPSGTAGDVLQMMSGAVVAVESSAGFLVFWDESGRAQRTVAEAAGTRIQPRHLARTPKGIAVTEPGRNRILFFDAFGTLSGERQLPAAPLGITASNGEVWVATKDHLICLTPPGSNAAGACPSGPAIISNPAGSGIVDLAVSPDAFYLLTRRALLRLSR